MTIVDSKEIMFYQSIDRFLKHIEHEEGYYVQFINHNEVSGRKALTTIRDYGMAYFRSLDMEPDMPVEISDIGKEVIRVGGAKRYIDSQKVVKFQTEQLQFDKLKYDVKNAERVYKSYWWTFGIAVSGLALAIFNFLKSFIN
jgi:hypothetical protein